MAGPETPGQAGPSEPPPPLPAGWIAQWDGMSRKYYYVQMSSGVSQWDIPTTAAPTVPSPGATPQQQVDHPYGQPYGHADNIITNPDGSQSIRLPDGRVEPYHSPAGGESDRGLGDQVLNQFLGGGKTHGSSGGGSNPLGALAGSLLSGKMSGGSSGHGGSGGKQNNSTANIVAGLASSFLNSGGKPAHNTTPNYSGQPSHNSNQQGSGNAGGMLGAIGGLLGGQQGQSHQQNYGYSNSGNQQQGGYSGQAPPMQYQPGNTPNQYGQSQHQHQQQHQPHQQHQQHQHQQQRPHTYGSPPGNTPYSAPPGNPPYHTPQPGHQQFSPPPQHNPSYGGYNPSPQPTYGQQQQPSYGSNPPYGEHNTQPPYGSQAAYIPPPSYGVPPPPPSGQGPSELYGGPPPSHQHGQHGQHGPPPGGSYY